MTIDERLNNLEKELACVQEALADLQRGKPAEEICAKNILLEDKEGNIRAALSTDENGPGLRLYDGNQEVMAALCTTPKGAALALSDKSGGVRTLLNADEDGSTLMMYDGNFKMRACLDISGDCPSMSLFDENGRLRVVLAILREKSGLALRDEFGKTRIELSSTADSSALVVHDGEGVIRSELSLGKFGPSLRMINEKGEVIWSAQESKPAGGDITK